MQRLRDSSLTLQLPVIAAACALIAGCAIVWLASTSSSYLQGKRDSAYGEALARQVANAVSNPLQRGDLLSVRASLQRFIDSSLALAIRINDVEGLPIGEAGDTRALEAARYSAQINIGEDIAGEVLVTLDPGTADSDRNRFLLSLLALALALGLLAFVLARIYAQRLATRLVALKSQLLLPGTDAPELENEVAALQEAVEHLPVDMLRGHAEVPQAAADFRDTVVLFVHLASLARYVNTLSESNLHRYTRRLQQLLTGAAQCYRGQLRVTRQFGLLITFEEQRNAGSEALRAASCARLVALVAEALEKRTSLSLELCLALGHCELAPADADDMYPDLYLQGSIDELHEACLGAEDYPMILASPEIVEEGSLGSGAVFADSGTRGDAGDHRETASAFRELVSLSEEHEALVRHQAALIVERIKPTARDAST